MKIFKSTTPSPESVTLSVISFPTTSSDIVKRFIVSGKESLIDEIVPLLVDGILEQFNAIELTAFLMGYQHMVDDINESIPLTPDDELTPENISEFKDWKFNMIQKYGYGIDMDEEKLPTLMEPFTIGCKLAIWELLLH